MCYVAASAVPSGVRRRPFDRPKDEVPDLRPSKRSSRPASTGTAVEVRDAPSSTASLAECPPGWRYLATPFSATSTGRAAGLAIGTAKKKGRVGVYAFAGKTSVMLAASPISRGARPVVASDRVFLRVQAPFHPISLIGGDRRYRLSSPFPRRAFVGLADRRTCCFGIRWPSTWLRGGAELDEIGAALRHDSRGPPPTLTAKVDVDYFAGAVAQPLAGVRSMMHRHVDRYINLHRALGKGFCQHEKSLREFRRICC